MTMTRVQLKQLAEIGARARLHEIQQELNDLRKEFPNLVQNADGSMPSVLPLVPKKKHQKAQKTKAERLAMHDAVHAFLASHPGALLSDIVSATGMKSNGAFTARYLTPIAVAQRLPGLPHQRWFLKGDPRVADLRRYVKTTAAANGSNGHATHRRGRAKKKTTTKVRGTRKPHIASGPKILAQRQASLNFLDTFDRSDPRRPNDRRIGGLVRRGYLAKKDDGYIRTAKPFHVSPNQAAAH